MFKRIVLLAGVLALPSAPALAQSIIAPVAATINSGGPGNGNIADTYNRAGLLTSYTPGVTNFDSYIAGNPQHSYVFVDNEWFSNNGTTSATVTYDLGSLRDIDRLALWNEDASGIGLLNLLASATGTTFTSLGSFTPVNNPINVNYGPQVFSFAQTSARFVRFEMSRCPQFDGGAFDGCAIGEVAFRQAAAVPEPGSWGMMLLGAGAIGAAARRRRSARVSFA